MPRPADRSEDRRGPPSGTGGGRDRKGTHVELTIERLEDGAVSPYLHDEVGVGDEVELRGRKEKTRVARLV